MSKPVERRTIACEFRVSKDDKPVIYGYAAKYGVRSEDLGGWVEVIAPGAFDAHLATSPTIKGLFNHDANLILGSTASGTMRVKSDKVGLGYEIDPPETQAAKDLMVSMARGDVNQSSFAFIAEDTAWGYDEVSGIDVRTIKQAQVMDCSPVCFPAYPQATSGVRKLPTDMPVEVRSKLSKRDSMEPADSPNDVGCGCGCDECMGNDCMNCSDPECTDGDCLANNQASRSIGKDAEEFANWQRRVQLKLRLARAKAHDQVLVPLS